MPEKTMYEKTKLVRYMMECYNKDCIALKYYEDMNFYPKMKTEYEKRTGSTEHFFNYRISKMNTLRSRIELIDMAKKAIGKEYETIITKEFCEQDKDWWIDYYSRATFYRKRRLAINAFLDYIGDIVAF